MLEGRDLRGLRVVVDAANGAASHIAGDVFGRAGAQVVVINATPDGRNINAGCGATDPAGLQAAVTAERAHAGIALDGDADRLIAVDERGDVVDGDHVIAICASDMRERGALRDDTVVVTVMANLGFHLAMRDAGIDVVADRRRRPLRARGVARRRLLARRRAVRACDLPRPRHDRGRHADRA